MVHALQHAQTTLLVQPSSPRCLRSTHINYTDPSSIANPRRVYFPGVRPKTVADELFGYEAEPDRDVRHSVRYLWRVSSAAAHGYYHYALSRVSLPEPGDAHIPPDIAILDAKIDKDVGPLLLTSYVVISRAIRLHRLRVTNHLAQPSSSPLSND